MGFHSGDVRVYVVYLIVRIAQIFLQNQKLVLSVLEICRTVDGLTTRGLLDAYLRVEVGDLLRNSVVQVDEVLLFSSSSDNLIVESVDLSLEGSYLLVIAVNLAINACDPLVDTSNTTLEGTDVRLQTDNHLVDCCTALALGIDVLFDRFDVAYS